MNKYDKALAQMEKKILYMVYKSWVYPLTDYGVEILGEAGIFIEYPFYYLDEMETEEERIVKMKENARLSLANNPKLFGFSHPQQRASKRFKFNMFGSKHPVGYQRDLKESVDFDISVTKEEVEQRSSGWTFSDIKEL